MLCIYHYKAFAKNNFEDFKIKTLSKYHKKGYNASVSATFSSA